MFSTTVPNDTINKPMLFFLGAIDNYENMFLDL